MSIPHAGFFRPPVKFKCLDGFLGIGPKLLPAELAGDPAQLNLELRINGALKQSVDFLNLHRDALTLLRDVNEFMTLHAGDVPMLGTGAGRPLANMGDRVDIIAPGLNVLHTLSHTLVNFNWLAAGASPIIPLGGCHPCNPRSPCSTRESFWRLA